MSRNVLNALLLSALAFGSVANAAPAPSQSFAELIHSGYRIISTFLVPPDVNPNHLATVTVTLTRDTSVAICVMNLGNYQSIASKPWPDDKTRCDIRSF
jgi:hypothetical protein